MLINLSSIKQSKKMWEKFDIQNKLCFTNSFETFL